MNPQSQIENELTKFVDDYIISRMNSWDRTKSNKSTNMYISNLRKEGEILFYDILLREQQDKKCKNSCN